MLADPVLQELHRRAVAQRGVATTPVAEHFDVLDLRRQGAGWKHHSFVGDCWQHIHKADRRLYLKNAYRVLLTRARQGMVIVVPQGAPEDPTRDPAFYGGTYRYLREIGIQEVNL